MSVGDDDSAMGNERAGDEQAAVVACSVDLEHEKELGKELRVYWEAILCLDYDGDHALTLSPPRCCVKTLMAVTKSTLLTRTLMKASAVDSIAGAEMPGKCNKSHSNNSVIFLICVIDDIK